MISEWKWWNGASVASVIGTIILTGAFVHAENKSLCDRLDTHIIQTNQSIMQVNQRIDDVNKRSDDLHKEFYSLLKEMNKK